MSAGWPYRCTGTSALTRGVTCASQAVDVERQRLGVDVDDDRRAPAAMTAERREGRRHRRNDDLVAWRRCRRRAAAARWRRCRWPLRRRTRAPDAAANSASKASTSGPENEPAARAARDRWPRESARVLVPGARSTNGSVRCRHTRADLRRRAARTARGARGRTRWSARSPSRSGVDGLQPSVRSMSDESAVKSPMSIAFFSGGHSTNRYRPDAGDARPASRRARGGKSASTAADVEHLPVRRVIGPRSQECVGGIVHVDEVANLPPVAVDLDLPILDRQTDEPADEPLPIVLEQLARAEDVGEPQRAGADAEHVVVDQVVVLAGRLVDAVDVGRLEPGALPIPAASPGRP